jgi:hypothetical protein
MIEEHIVGTTDDKISVVQRHLMLGPTRDLA